MTEESELIGRARGGDREAMDHLVMQSQDLVYNLAIRMLGNPAEAADMSQEILMRVVNGIDTFRGESAFRTWVYRVASNHLLTARKRMSEERFENLEAMGAFLDKGLASGEPALDDQVIVNEAKMICTSTMMLCLDRDHRLAFILGEVLELASDEGAEILQISEEAFRKRLSRARDRIGEFMGQRCGLVDEKLACRCGKIGAAAKASGRLDPNAPQFSACPTRPRAAREPETKDGARVDELDTMERAVAVFRSHPEYIAPSSLIKGVRTLIDSPKSDLLR